MKDTRSKSVISKKQILHMIVGLIEISDYSLIEKGSILTNEVCAESDIDKIKELAALIKYLLSNFDYTSSIEFSDSIVGKSESYKVMKLNSANKPASKKKYLALFGEAICDLEGGERVDQLVSKESKKTLAKARELLESINNP